MWFLALFLAFAAGFFGVLTIQMFKVRHTDATITWFDHKLECRKEDGNCGWIAGLILTLMCAAGAFKVLMLILGLGGCPCA